MNNDAPIPRLRSRKPRLRSWKPKLRTRKPRLCSWQPKLRSRKPRLRSRKLRLCSWQTKLRSQKPRLRYQKNISGNWIASFLHIWISGLYFSLPPPGRRERSRRGWWLCPARSASQPIQYRFRSLIINWYSSWRYPVLPLSCRIVV